MKTRTVAVSVLSRQFKMASASNGKDYALTFALGVSVGVLFALLYTEVYGMNFILGCFYKTTTSHETLTKIGGLYETSRATIIKYDDLDDVHHKGGDMVAKELAKNIKVLCWVLTSQGSVDTRARAVRETWGKRCNTLLIMDAEGDANRDVIGLNQHGLEGQDVWSKTRAAWKYVYDSHLNDADWFIKADDDTFVIVENLRFLVSRYDNEKPYYIGRWFKASGGYNTESAGYVFNKETLKTFIRAMNNPMKCVKESSLQDSNVGACLRAFGVHPSDTRDSHGRETFHPFAPEYHVVPNAIKNHHWLHGSNQFPVYSGPNCCSDRSVTFHGLNHDTMYILEYLIYHLKPYGYEQITKSSHEENIEKQKHKNSIETGTL